MSELKPCPFCGGEAELSKSHPNPLIDWGGRYGTTVWEVYCSNTGCPCEVGSGWQNTEAEAIEAWNTRATDYSQAQVTHSCPCGAQRTCKFTPYVEGADDGTCSKCGEYMYEQDNYCPSCGARVKEDTDAD